MKYVRLVSVAVVSSFFVFPTAGAQFFTRVTEAGSVVSDSVRNFGASWCDYNGDGYPDLYSVGERNDMYVNNRDGTFSPIDSGHFVTTQGYSVMAAWADFNNDGYQDLYLANYGVISGGGTLTQRLPNYLYMNGGPPDFPMVIVDIGTDTTVSVSSSWIDHDNDGDLDLFVPGAAGTTDLFYRNNGDGTFLSLNTIPFVRTHTNGSTDSWIDYDGDGDTDLFNVLQGAVNELWKNMISETAIPDSFQRITTSGLTDEGNIFDIAASWGDYDNDGDFDVFIAASGVFGNGAADRLYENQGDGTFARILTGPVVAGPSNSSFGAWGDYDNDGDIDLFVAHINLSPSVPALFRNDGGGLFTRMTESEVGEILLPLSAAQAGNWADYDNDGDLDLYVANFAQSLSFSGTPKPNDLIRNNGGNANNWVVIRCRGTASNSSGVGAVVRVKALLDTSYVWQSRSIIAGPSGNTSQGDLRTHFGLLHATVIDSVVIDWPGGERDIHTGVLPNRIYEAIEGGGIVSSVSGQEVVPNEHLLRQNYPNPFNPTTEIAFTIAGRQSVALKIYDLLGREIRTLVNEVKEPGVYTVAFDGTGLASGVYLYRLRAGPLLAQRKMLLVR